MKIPHSHDVQIEIEIETAQILFRRSNSSTISQPPTATTVAVVGAATAKQEEPIPIDFNEHLNGTNNSRLDAFD